MIIVVSVLDCSTVIKLGLDHRSDLIFVLIFIEEGLEAIATLLFFLFHCFHLFSFSLIGQDVKPFLNVFTCSEGFFEVLDLGPIGSWVVYVDDLVEHKLVEGLVILVCHP